MAEASLLSRFVDILDKFVVKYATWERFQVSRIVPRAFRVRSLRVRTATESIVGAAKLAESLGTLEESRPKMQHTVSEILHDDVRGHAVELCERSELLKRAQRGNLGARAVLDYLTGVRYLTEQTPRMFDVAASAAERKQLPRLAAHFRAKRREETGHHVWAENDIRGVSEALGARATAAPSRALVELIAYLEREIEESPVRYLGYALLVEYVTVAVGPLWVGALERNSGVSAKNLTIVTHHVALDGAHVEADLEEIRELAPASELSGMRETIRGAIGYFETFLSELLEVAEAA